MALPHTVTQNHDRRAAGAVLLGKETPADHRLDAQEREKRCSDYAAGNAFRLAPTGKVGLVPYVGSDVAQSLALIFPRDILTRGGERTPGISLDVNEAFRFLIRQWTEEHRVDNSEDCCSGSDAQSEGEYCCGGEAGIPAHHSDAVAKVLPKRIEEMKRPRIAAFFFGFVHTA